MSTRRRENIIYGGVALGSAAFMLWVIPAHTPPYPGYGVSAALLPYVTVGIMLVLSLGSLLRNLLLQVWSKGRSAEESRSEAGNPEGRVHLLHLARFMIPAILLMPAMMWVGFIPAGLLFMLVMQYLCGQRRLLPAVFTAVGSVCLLYVAMRYGLGVPMP